VLYRLGLIVYNLLFPFLFLLYFPFYLVKLERRGGWRDGFGERFGLFSADKKTQLSALDRPVWIHAVSVGETVAALSFIKIWRERDPDLTFVLSTTTSTGQAIARKRAPEGVVPIYCPLDHVLSAGLALSAIRPRMLVIFEVEIWPTLIAMAARRGATPVLVNCRMSDSSAAGYAKHKAVFAPVFANFATIAVQSDTDAERIRTVIGDGDTVHVCNTMKYDQSPDVEGADVSGLLDTAFGEGGRLVFAAASTHPGEEALVSSAVASIRSERDELVMILVPRHVERIDDVETALRDAGLSWNRLTRLRDTEAACEPAPVLIVDTTGEMMNFLAAGDIVYVGKSLAGQEGGHNIIEPAILGKPIMHGPNMQNFRLVVDQFRAAEATIEVSGDADFEKDLRELAANEALRQRLGAAARQTVDANRGATVRTIELITNGERR
jgi:3-deoxy-D-manno-octulosonic-acid transferase